MGICSWLFILRSLTGVYTLSFHNTVFILESLYTYIYWGNYTRVLSLWSLYLFFFVFFWFMYGVLYTWLLILGSLTWGLYTQVFILGFLYFGLNSWVFIIGSLYWSLYILVVLHIFLFVILESLNLNLYTKVFIMGCYTWAFVLGSLYLGLIVGSFKLDVSLYIHGSLN